MTSIELRLTHPAGASGDRHGEPVTVGVPLPRGLERSTDRWAVVDADGSRRRVQTRVLDRWSDGSIRWAAVDCQLDSRPGSPASAWLVTEGTAPAATDRASAQDRDGGIEVDTGAARFRLSTDAPLLFEDAVVAGTSVLNAAASSLRAIIGGAACAVSWRSLAIDDRGPLRVSVRADGDARRGTHIDLHLTLRLDFYAGLGAVRLRLTVRNPRRAAHQGGIWELGDAGSVRLDDLSLVLRRATPSAEPLIRFSAEPGEPLQAAPGHVDISQESSGGERWMSANHVNRDGVVSLRWRGYRVTTGRSQHQRERATPVVTTSDGGDAMSAAVPYFWQNFPRSLAASREDITVGFFPAAAADAQELQGGEQKTHECYLLFGVDRVTRAPLEWCRSRAIVAPVPEWYAGASAAPYMVPASAADARYSALAGAALDGDDTFEAKRERVDEYGWRHFGDIYGDHEAVGSNPSTPLVSHYNNQYDPIAGFAYQFMRTGDARWLVHAAELAAHVVDIDIYHTDNDKSAYNHGLFWHTVHYVDAGKSTHRTYPRAKGSNGGGPSAEHNYTSGLMLRYLMTGDPVMRDAAIELAQFVLDIDDGRKTPFSWFSWSDTGKASASRTPLYHGPGRGSGNSLNALVDGHRLTRDRRFLDKAEQLIVRVVHPGEPLEPLGLLDRENRWFYTMFLQSLAKYLDHKLELGELDAMYGYAQYTLRHYARWMAGCEYPYLDKPEQLEYPTETWAAQDLRKTDVFDAAARHSRGDERERFIERATYFFARSIETLEASPTRTLARPVVLLLSYGYTQAHPCRHAEAPLADGPRGFGNRKPFVPQKLLAMRRAALLAGMSAAAALFALARLLL